jgi:hypothetical protein
MTTRRRRTYRFRSRKAAEEAYRLEEQARLVNYWAVQAVLRGEVQWLPPEAPYRAGLIRPDGSVGGVVVVLWEAQDSIGLHVDVWTVDQFVSCYGPGCPPFRTSDAERMALYRLAVAVKEARDRACDEARDKACCYSPAVSPAEPLLMKETPP